MDTNDEQEPTAQELASDFAAFDSKATAEFGAVCHLESPWNGNPLYLPDGSAFTITLLGPDSAKMRAYVRKITDKHTEAWRKNKNPVTSDVTEREKAEGLALVTVSWNIPPVDGKPLPCNEANARRLYADPRFPWVVEQINAFVGDRRNFFKPAPTN